MKKTTTILRHVCCSFMALLLSACIKNDFPLPTIVGEILDIEVEGQVGIRFSEANREVSISVADTIDLRQLLIKKLVVTKDMRIRPDSLACIDFLNFPDTSFVSHDSLPATADTRVNFQKPVQFLLSLYQDYPWTVRVERQINHLIKVQHQVGPPLIDVDTKTILLYVDPILQPSLRNVVIEEMQLGGSLAETVPNFQDVTDFTRPRLFYVSLFDEVEEWTIGVQYPGDDVQTTELSVWTRRAYLKGDTKTGNVEIRYRAKGSELWENVLSNEITHTDDSFLAMLTHLRPLTEYEYELSVDGTTNNIETFTTDSIQQVPNLSFDNWFLDGKTWYPNVDNSVENYFWDSGNEGASIVSLNPTAPEERDVVKGKAASLTSVYISLASKFAAGNIYTGQFVALAGLEGAELDFGYPYTNRPSFLKGHYKYNSGVIDIVSNAYEHLKGTKDSCHIYIGLFDWTAPFRVNSTKEQFVDLSPETNESLIALGELKTDQSTGGEYQSFKIPLVYQDYFRRPTYILIVASASKYGDYFTGSTSSVLLLDEFELGFE